MLGERAFSGNPNPAPRLVFARDGAQTWTEYQIGPISSDWRYPGFDRLQFADALDGWLRANTALYHTSDGGQRWVQLH